MSVAKSCQIDPAGIATAGEGPSAKVVAHNRQVKRCIQDTDATHDESSDGHRRQGHRMK